MKKMLTIILSVIMCFCVVACGNKENSYTEEIDGFENASINYEKFNSYASDNGLGDSLIFIEGKVLNQTRFEDEDLPTLALIIEQESRNRWCVQVVSDNEIEGIDNKNVRIFGTYMGFSDVMNLPGIAVYIKDMDKIELARIDVENENGEYETVWKFSDYVNGEIDEKTTEQAEDENSNAELIDKLEWKYDENNYFTVGIFKDAETGKTNISAFGKYEEQNIGLMQRDFTLIWASGYGNRFDVSYGCEVGEESYAYIMSDGEVLMSTIPTDETKEIPEKYTSLAADMAKAVDDFYVNNGIKDKTYNQH